MKTKPTQKNIPDGWEVTKIEEIAPLQRGFDLPVVQIKDGDYPVVFSNGVLAKHNVYKVKGPGVVTGRSGTLGQVHYIKENFWPHNTSLWVTDFKGNSPKFIFYFYKNLGLLRFGTGSGVPTLNRNDVHRHNVFFPPLPEQNRIVKVLEAWDEAIEVLAKKIKHKKEIKKGLMQNLLTGKIRLPKLTNKWELIKLSDVGSFSKGMGVLKDEVTELGHNVVRYGELYTKYNFKIEKVFSHIPDGVVPTTKKIKYGDILFAGSGETADEIGKSVAYLSKEDCYAGGDIIVFTPKKSHSLFLSYFFNTGVARKKFSQLGQGNSVVHLYKSDLEKLSFELPETEEQDRIASILDASSKEISELEKKLSLIKEQKKFLLNNLITGTIRTPKSIK